MLSHELQHYIEVRNGQLASDEMLYVIDLSRHPQIARILFENGRWQMWDVDGNYFTFTKREWN